MLDIYVTFGNFISDEVVSYVDVFCSLATRGTSVFFEEDVAFIILV